MNYFLIFFGVIVLFALVNYLIGLNVKIEEEKLENIDNKNTKPKAEHSSKKHPPDNLEQFKEAINLFINEMKKMPDWYEIIQARGNGHAMFAKSMGIKVDDYEHWANAH